MQGSSGQSSTFLDLLTPTDRGELVTRASIRTYRKRETVFRQGDSSNIVFFVRSGHFAVIRSSTDGAESVLALRGPGDIVGEQAILDDQSRSATVRAVTKAELFALTGSAFELFVNEHPSSAFALLRSLSIRLKESDQARAAASNEPVSMRLARLLIDLGGGTSGVASIAMPLNQDELGSWIGASREATAKSLRLLRELGAIATDRRMIHILDAEALRRVATA